jgi:acyl dehydratase
VGLSGDYNPLYTDQEHARAAHYGGPVAPGALVAAITTGLGSMDVPLPATVGLVGMSWKFLIPVQPGDTLGSRWRLSRKRNVENPRWGLAVWQVEVENQRGEIVASGEVARLIVKREQPAERTGRSRRRRRKGAPAGQTAADVVMDEPVPEPAPADVPPAGARRRRRRGPAEPAPEQPATAAVETAEAAPAAQPEAASEQGAGAPAEPAPSRRRRRRRSSNGHDNGRQSGGPQPEGVQQEDSRPPEVPFETTEASPEPVRRSEPAPSPFTGGDSEGDRPSTPRAWPADEEAPADAGTEEGGLGRVFRRLRRP